MNNISDSKRIKGILKNKGSVSKQNLNRRISWGEIRQRNFFEDNDVESNWEEDEIKPLLEQMTGSIESHEIKQEKDENNNIPSIWVNKTENEILNVSTLESPYFETNEINEIHIQNILNELDNEEQKLNEFQKHEENKSNLNVKNLENATIHYKEENEEKKIENDMDLYQEFINQKRTSQIIESNNSSKRRKSDILNSFNFQDHKINKQDQNYPKIEPDFSQFFYQYSSEKPKSNNNSFIKEIEIIASATKYNKIDSDAKKLYKGISTPVEIKELNIILRESSIKNDNLLKSEDKINKNILDRFHVSPSNLLEDNDYSKCEKSYFKINSDDKENNNLEKESILQENNIQIPINTIDKDKRDPFKSRLTENFLSIIEENSDEKINEKEICSLWKKKQNENKENINKSNEIFIKKDCNLSKSPINDQLIIFGDENRNSNDKLNIKVIDSSSKSVHFYTTFSDEKEKKKFKKTPNITPKRTYNESKLYLSPEQPKRLKFSPIIQESNSKIKENETFEKNKIIINNERQIKNNNNFNIEESIKKTDPLINLIKMSPLPENKRNRLVEIFNNRKPIFYDSKNILENLKENLKNKVQIAKLITQKLIAKKQELTNEQLKVFNTNKKYNELKIELEQKKKLIYENQNINIAKSSKINKLLKIYEIILGIQIIDPIDFSTFTKNKILRFKLPKINNFMYVAEMSDKYPQKINISPVFLQSEVNENFILIHNYINKKMEKIYSENNNFLIILQAFIFYNYSVNCSQEKIKKYLSRYYVNEPINIENDGNETYFLINLYSNETLKLSLDFAEWTEKTRSELNSYFITYEKWRTNF